MPLVIGLLGGPGIGKSTTAAGIYYELSSMGYNCELINEFAKTKVLENSISVLEDQLYVFAKQYHKQLMAYNNVDIVITDSPLLLSLYYGKNNSKTFNDLVLECNSEFNNKFYFLKRDEKIKYQEIGRCQTFEESLLVHQGIKSILNNNNIEYTEVDNLNAVTDIVFDTTLKFCLDKKVS